MKQNANHFLWISFRIIIVFLFTYPSLLGFWDDGKWTFHSFINPAYIVAIIAFIFLAGFSNMQYILKKSIKERKEKSFDILFYRPSWFLNPFMKNEPYQYMHMFSIAFLVSGITGLGRYLILSSKNSSIEWLIPIFLLVLGASWLNGIYINIFLNRDKFRKYTMSGRGVRS